MGQPTTACAVPPCLAASSIGAHSAAIFGTGRAAPTDPGALGFTRSSWRPPAGGGDRLDRERSATRLQRHPVGRGARRQQRATARAYGIKSARSHCIQGGSKWQLSGGWYANRVSRHRGDLVGSAACIAVLLVSSCIPTAPPTTPSSSTPSAEASTSSPSPASSDGPAFVFDLENDGQVSQLFLFDPGSALASARPADDAEAALALPAIPLGSDIVAIQGESENVVIVAWLPPTCDRQAGLLVEEMAITVELAPSRGCDAVAIGRTVALQFADPVRASDIVTRLIPGEILPEPEPPPTPVAPPPTAEGH